MGTHRKDDLKTLYHYNARAGIEWVVIMMANVMIAESSSI